jgi:hypothetical protein
MRYFLAQIGVCLMRGFFARYIKRFSEEGKKLKSQGNYVWTVEAKKTPTGTWIFREFERKFINEPNTLAYIGMRWSYTPQIWDPQVACKLITFCSHEPLCSL